MRYKKYGIVEYQRKEYDQYKNDIKIRIALLLLMFSPFVIFLGCQNDAPNTPEGWTLLWSDEFDYSGPPDPDKWVYEYGMLRNEEAQYYTSRLENVEVTEGCLVITARKENYGEAAFHCQQVSKWHDSLQSTV